MAHNNLIKAVVGLVLAGLVAFAAVGPANAMQDLHYVKKVDRASP